MAKNIIVCSDGTGNRGGKSFGTNVWRLYNGVDLNNREYGVRQITYYDDGVGTEDNKYLRVFAGAFGWGISKNIKRAYKFLCLNYQPGDKVYLFGFSRGAYAIRALAAFISQCGYISNASQMPDVELDKTIESLINYYHSTRSVFSKLYYMCSIRFIGCRFSKDSVFSENEVTALGVWDTVSAVGLPFDVGIRAIVNNVFFRFNFKDFELSPNIKRAYHSLSIDDERHTFHPIMWDENHKDMNEQDIKQVWFAGSHSNVGGGYPKQHMSYVTLMWMLEQIGDETGQAGIIFKPSFQREVHEMENVHGKLIDSRTGLASYYRYEPRDILKLCQSHNCKVNIHSTVFERIRCRTSEYAPGNLLRALLKSGQYLNDNIRKFQNELSLYATQIRWIESHRMIIYFALVMMNLIALNFLGQFWLASIPTGPVIISTSIMSLVLFSVVAINWIALRHRSKSYYAFMCSIIGGVASFILFQLVDFHPDNHCRIENIESCHSYSWFDSVLPEFLSKPIVFYHDVYNLYFIGFFVVFVLLMLFRYFSKKAYHRLCDKAWHMIR